MGKMIAALKKLGNKLNGKVPVMDNTVGVINEIADDYEKPDLTPYATKTYVDGLMSGALKRQIVQVLPQTNIDTNTIYMVLDQEASQPGNVYNEYLYINENWELIGTTQVSGSGVEYVFLNPNTTEIDLETAEKLTDDTNKYNCVIVLRTGDEASPNTFLRPDGEFLNTYTSNIINGKYWKFEITDWQEEGIFVSITEEPVGVEYVTVARNNPEIDYSDYQKLLAGAYIRIDNQQEAEWISSEIICLPNHNADKYVYTSTVKDGKHYKVVVTVLDHTEAEFEATCRIYEETVGGSVVIANPELTGDERLLMGLQVNDVEYKIEPPTLSIPVASPFIAYVGDHIYGFQSAVFNWQELKTYLSNTIKNYDYMTYNNENIDILPSVNTSDHIGLLRISVDTGTVTVSTSSELDFVYFNTSGTHSISASGYAGSSLDDLFTFLENNINPTILQSNSSYTNPNYYYYLVSNMCCITTPNTTSLYGIVDFNSEELFHTLFEVGAS